MTVCLGGEVAIRVPEWVRDFDTFVTWMHSDEFPEEGRIDFLNGEVWIDISMEELYSHNFVKSAVAETLNRLVREDRLGIFVSDGMRFTNADAGVATVPDALFFTFDTLNSGRIVTRAGPDAVATELRGSPDLVVEVVSPSSEDKDTEWFLSAYWNAGVAEYWLIDARGKGVRFDVFKRGPRGYTAARKSGGWVKSAVFGKAFRLTRTEVAAGIPSYVLDAK